MPLFLSNEYFDINPISWLKFFKIRQIFHPRRAYFTFQQLIIYKIKFFSRGKESLHGRKSKIFNQSNIFLLLPFSKEPKKFTEIIKYQASQDGSTFKSNDVQTKSSREGGGGV